MGNEEREKATTTATNEEAEQLPPALASGMPPWHALAFVTTMLPVSVPFLPSLEEIDSISQPIVWTTRKFPNLISLEGLAFLRLGIAAIAIGVAVYLVVISPGWDVYPNYKPRSGLRRVFIKLRGIGTLCPFTSWSWVLLGVGFFLRGLIALAAAKAEGASDGGGDVPEWAVSILEHSNLLRATLITWELSAPFAILVSTVTKYVLWPVAIKGGKPHNLAGVRNQLQHNLNSVSILLEATLLGGPPVKFSHLSVAFVMGIVYISFTWIMAVVYFGDSTVGPQYIYWFFDTTLGKTTTIAIVGLTTALTTFFVVFSLAMSTFLGGGGDEPPSLLLNIAFLVVGTHLVCKFRQ